jgi:hypothetical protein
VSIFAKEVINNTKGEVVFGWHIQFGFKFILLGICASWFGSFFWDLGVPNKFPPSSH